jgi:hypothetical protein
MDTNLLQYWAVGCLLGGRVVAKEHYAVYMRILKVFKYLTASAYIDVDNFPL